jgi:hypothetical protein
VTNVLADIAVFTLWVIGVCGVFALIGWLFTR